MGRTGAFNLQQGAMLHWIDGLAGRQEVAYNDWDGDRLISRAVHPETGAARTIDAPIAAVSNWRGIATSIDFARGYHIRPVTGYANVAHAPIDPRPDHQGLSLIDLRTGRSHIVLSVAQIMAAAPVPPELDGPAWFDHVTFNPAGTRILFLLCIARSAGQWLTSLWTADPDGGELRRQIGWRWISHFDWIDDERLLVSTDLLGSRRGFVAFTDGASDFEPYLPDLLPEDGHATFSPDRRWLVCDTYPRGEGRLASLYLIDIEQKVRHTLGAFHHPRQFAGDARCDLHPRWRRDGRVITFDSVHEGSRQIYVADVAELCGR